MTSKERFIRALTRQPVTGHVPHFELVFYLTMESIGKVHPSHRSYPQWNQMSRSEQKLQMEDMAACYIEIAEKYSHDAIFIHPNPGDYENTIWLLEILREKTGDKYFTMMHGDPTYSIPDGDHMEEFSRQLYEDGEVIKYHTERNIAYYTELAERFRTKNPGLLDGFTLCADYCFNTNPFFSPAMFAEYITPYLQRILKTYRDMDYYTIKHTDGNIMPIVDQIAECRPDALHSLDPQGGVDLAEMKRLYGNRLTLIGNVNCGLLQTGTREECAADIRRALRDGMPCGGYIFSTSNCAYTGLPLERYELMHKIWLEEGIY